jgi:predicted deacetylase
MTKALAVAMHDVEPRSLRRSREIRGWLLERGVEQVTLLVIPAADLHPIGPRCPALAAWLRERVACGDTVGQHGLSHRAAGRAMWPRSVLASWQGGRAAEFPGLDADETRQRVAVGLTLLRELELDPHGFVAPGYAYTRALRRTLHGSFQWFADLRGVVTRSDGRIGATALCLGSSTPLKRAVSPVVVRAAASVRSPLMRIDVHPADFDRPGHVATLEALLELARERRTITYDAIGA